MTMRLGSWSWDSVRGWNSWEGVVLLAASGVASEGSVVLCMGGCLLGQCAADVDDPVRPRLRREDASTGCWNGVQRSPIFGSGYCGG